MIKPFDCSDCVAFCCSGAYLVALEGKDVARLALHLGRTTAEVRRLYTTDGRTLRQRNDPVFERACVFLELEKRECSVYTARPEACRAWPRPEHAAPGTEGRCAFYDLYSFVRNEQEPRALPLVQIVRVVGSHHPATQPKERSAAR